MRQLETELGLPLLVRHARGVRATKAGARLYERAMLIVKSLDETQREMASLRGAELVRLGLTPSLMNAIGKDIQARIDADVKSVDVQMKPGISRSLVDMIKRGDIDLALAYGIERAPGVRGVHLYDEKLYLVTSPNEGIGKSSVTLAQALDYPLAIQTEQSAIYHTVLEAARAHSRTLNVAFQARSTDGILNIASHGLAAGILPASVVARPLSEGKVAAHRIERPALHRALYIVRKSGRRRTKAQEAFDQFLLDLFREHAPIWIAPVRLPKR